MPSFYLFAYYQALRDLRVETRPMESQIHKVRDALMSGGLFPVLGERGYKYGGTILNLPLEILAGLRQSDRLRATTTRFDESDLILLATRPPLDDRGVEAAFEGKRKLLSSGHDLEKLVLRSLRGFFAKCDRETIRLDESVPLGENDWLREVHFYQSKGAAVRYYAVRGKRMAPDCRNRTVGYLISVPGRGNGVPRLLAAFGPGGTETLVFGYLLREDPRLRTILGEMLTGADHRIVVCTFRLPVRVPYPFLRFGLEELDATVRIDRILPRGPTAGKRSRSK